jgi:hypothetical protein
LEDECYYFGYFPFLQYFPGVVVGAQVVGTNLGIAPRCDVLYGDLCVPDGPDAALDGDVAADTARLPCPLVEGCLYGHVVRVEVEHSRKVGLWSLVVPLDVVDVEAFSSEAHPILEFVLSRDGVPYERKEGEEVRNGGGPDLRRAVHPRVLHVERALLVVEVALQVPQAHPRKLANIEGSIIVGNIISKSKKQFMAECKCQLRVLRHNKLRQSNQVYHNYPNMNNETSSQERVEVYILAGLLGFLLATWLIGAAIVKTVQHCRSFKANTRERSNTEPYNTLDSVIYNSQHN